MNSIYEASGLLYYPALLCIGALFLYSVIEAGMLCGAYLGRAAIARWLTAYGSGQDGAKPAGLSVLGRLPADATLNEAEIVALKRLEGVRMTARIAPMAGLIATLVPMGPALLALTRNDIGQMGELLRNAVAAVVFALAAASIAFWVASVRKRWCAEELAAFEKRRGA